MKIMVIGCTHVGKKLAGYDWKSDLKRVMGEVTERANQADLLVHLGDLFDVGRPSPGDYAFALEMLDGIACPMIIMKGNHDECPGLEPDALEPLMYFRFREEVKIVRSPVVIGLEDFKFAFIPFQNDAKAKASGAESAQAAADELFSAVRREHAVSVLFTHVDVDGLGHPVEETSQRVGVALKLEELQALPLDVVVGHYHRSVQVKPNVYVPGSVLPFDFSEVGIEKFNLMLTL